MNMQSGDGVLIGCQLIYQTLSQGVDPLSSERLVDSGVAADGHRASWGLVSRAVDGHLCRSALERTIDDWMHANGVAHVPESTYPRDAELNAHGLLRADWAHRRHLVEAFGALGVEEYAVKAARKRELVCRHGLRSCCSSAPRRTQRTRTANQWLTRFTIGEKRAVSLSVSSIRRASTGRLGCQW
ncbi:hypothetical protein BJF81_15795 [Ornithinimicrobium sp. CNJ-824]|nr:hypothetical protein BJF81_15795 [Ornithinimicrobium sp. CNJ-824]